jgi:hypothetical protein
MFQYGSKPCMHYLLQFMVAVAAVYDGICVCVCLCVVSLKIREMKFFIVDDSALPH